MMRKNIMSAGLNGLFYRGESEREENVGDSVS